jgi:hypothetical protein
MFPWHEMIGIVSVWNIEGIEFQQGLPDLDNLDPREKHLIIYDDLMDETEKRVASLFTKKSHHRNIFHDSTYAFCSSPGKMKVLNLRISGVFCFISITM